MTEAIQTNKIQPRVLYTSGDYVKALKDVEKIEKAVPIAKSLVNFSQYVKAYTRLVERVIATNDAPETNNPNLRIAHSKLTEKLQKLEKRISAASAKTGITPPSKELIQMLKVDEPTPETPKSNWTKTDIAKYSAAGGIIVFSADKLWKFAKDVDDLNEKIQNMPGALKDALRGTGNNMAAMADIAKEGTSFFGLTINEIREFLRKNFNISTTDPGDPFLVGATTMGTYWLVNLILDMGPFSVLKAFLPDNFFKGLATGVSAIVGCNAINENCAQSFLDTFKSALKVLLQYKKDDPAEFAKFAGAFSFLATNYKDALTGFFTNANGGLRDFGLGQKAGYAMTFVFFKEYLQANHKEAHDALMVHFQSYSYKIMNGALQAFEIVKNDVPKQINEAYTEFPVTTSLGLASLTAAILKFAGPVAINLWNGAAAITPSMDTVVGLGIFGTGLYHSGLVKKETVDQLLKDSEQIASNTMNWAEQKGVPGAKSVGRAIAEGIDLKAAPAVKEHINENPVSTVAGYAVGRTTENIARQYNFGRPVQVITRLVTSALPYGFKKSWNSYNSKDGTLGQAASGTGKFFTNMKAGFDESYEKGTLLQDGINLANDNFETAVAVSGLAVGAFGALLGGPGAGITAGALTMAGTALLRAGTESYNSEDGWVGQAASGTGKFFTTMKAGFDESYEKGTLWQDGVNLVTDNSVASTLGQAASLTNKHVITPIIQTVHDHPYVTTVAATTAVAPTALYLAGAAMVWAFGGVIAIPATLFAKAAAAGFGVGSAGVGMHATYQSGIAGQAASGTGKFFTHMKAGFDESYEKGTLWQDGVNLVTDNSVASTLGQATSLTNKHVITPIVQTAQDHPYVTTVAATTAVAPTALYLAGAAMVWAFGGVIAIPATLFAKAAAAGFGVGSAGVGMHATYQSGIAGQAASGTGKFFTHMKAGFDESYEKGTLWQDGINLVTDNSVASTLGQVASGTGKFFMTMKAGFDESLEKSTLWQDGINLVTDNSVASTLSQVASLTNKHVITPIVQTAQDHPYVTTVAATTAVAPTALYLAGAAMVWAFGGALAIPATLFAKAAAAGFGVGSAGVGMHATYQSGIAGQAASGTGRFFTNMKAGFDESYEKGTLMQDGINLVTDNPVASAVGQVASLGNEYVVQPALNNRVATSVKESVRTFAKENFDTTFLSAFMSFCGAMGGSMHANTLAEGLGKGTLGALAGAAIPVVGNLVYYNAVEPAFGGVINALEGLVPNLGVEAGSVDPAKSKAVSLEIPGKSFKSGTQEISPPRNLAASGVQTPIKPKKFW